MGFFFKEILFIISFSKNDWIQSDGGLGVRKGIIFECMGIRGSKPCLSSANEGCDNQLVVILAGAVCNIWEFVLVQTYHA